MTFASFKTVVVRWIGNAALDNRNRLDPMSDDFGREVTRLFREAVAERKQAHRAEGVPFYTLDQHGQVVDALSRDRAPGQERRSAEAPRRAAAR